MSHFYSTSGFVSLVGWACGLGDCSTVALGLLAAAVYTAMGTGKA